MDLLRHFTATLTTGNARLLANTEVSREYGTKTHSALVICPYRSQDKIVLEYTKG